MKTIKKIAIFVLAVLLLALPLAASAESYVLDGIERISVPSLYEKEEVFQSFSQDSGESLYLSKPQDLFISKKGNLFVVDSGNNRVLKLDANGQLLAVFKDAAGQTFNNPQGIFVDENENMYIADTDNGRIVHLDYLGNFVEELGRPDGLPGEETTYNPAKIAISSTGTIYVVKGQNILSIDANNNFKGYIGQAEIGFDLTEAIIRLLASEEQKATLARRTAATYNNIAIDESDNLYCASMDNTLGEIKRLNSVGTNTYRQTGGTSAFSLNLASLFLSNSYIASSGTAFYGDRMDDEGKAMEPNFSDVAYDKNGLVYALDSVLCRLYIYDAEGELLGTVGGKGNQKGKFVTPTAVAVAEDGTLYILDSNLNNLQSFKPTAFKKAIEQALTLYYNGDYKGSQQYWEQVLAVNENYNLALKGMGQTCYKEGNYAQAIDYFRRAENVTGYSNAYGKQQHDWIRGNFAIFLVILAAVLAAVYFYIKWLRSNSKKVCYLQDIRSEKRFEYPQLLRLIFSTLFHPLETFDNVRYMRGRLKWSPAFIFLGLTVAVRFLYMNIVHYPLSDVNLRDASYVLEAVKFLLPFITFVIAAYAVTTIMDGEVEFKELFFVCSLCFAPYLAVTLPLGLFSHVMTSANANMYSTVQTIIWIWTFFLFFQTIRVMNQYTVKKTIGVAIISVLTMLLMWVVAFLVIVLWNQIWLFISDILVEIGLITG